MLSVTLAAIFAWMHAAAAAAQEIPFRLVDNMILVPIEVNGVATLGRLDTGGSLSLIHPTFSRDLGLMSSGSVVASGASGKMRQYIMVSPVEVKLGDRVVKSEPLMVISLNSMASDAKHRVGITLGMDVVRDLVVEIDFDRLMIEFRPAADFTDFPKAEPMELRWARGGRALMGAVTGWKSIRVHFDTGNPGAVNFGEYVARSALKGRPSSQFLAVGVDGSHPHRKSTLPSLTLAGVTFKDVPASVRPDTGDRTIGVGLEVLKRFNLVMDFTSERMWMTPNSKATEPFRRDRVGIGTYSNGWPRSVTFVSPGSPAERAGFKAGEMLARMLDESGAELDDLDDLAEGQRITVLMADGSRRELVAQTYY
jgi:hypothetical protein